MPFLSTVVFSFTDYSVLRPPRFVGLENYREAVYASDDLFPKSLWRDGEVRIDLGAPQAGLRPPRGDRCSTRT